jgi:hypothetical protein
MSAALGAGFLMMGAAIAEPLSAEQERVIKRNHAPAPVVALPIDWVAAHAARQSLPVDAITQARMQQARQPVLLPSVDGWTGRVFLTVGAGWHTAALDVPGAHLEIQANANAHVRPDLLAEQAAAGLGTGAPRVSQMHGIFTLSFERFGISYSLDLECASHTDARCADAGYLMQIYDSLVVAGGQP